MSYIAEYTRPYKDGYKNRPSEETPEMAEFMNKRDDTLLKIEAFLKDLDLSGLGSEYALLSEAGYSLDVSMDDYYVLTISLKNKAGDALSSKSVDLPIESMIIDIDYADGVLTLTLQNGNTVNVSIIDIVRGLVPETRKIAGIDLKDDITVAELKSALGIKGGGESDASTLDVTYKITPNPDITFTDLKYEAIQIGNMVLLTFTIQREGGTVGTLYNAFSIDASIIPNASYSNIVYGAGGSKNALVKAVSTGVVSFDGGGWGEGSIQWFTDASTTEIDKTTGGELKPWLYDTSGEEVLVGVYNGKPMYRKIFTYNLTLSENWAELEISLDNIEHAFISHAYAVEENGTTHTIPTVNEPSSQFIGLFISSDYTYVGIRTSEAIVGKRYPTFCITIEYTKTTDAEGSGNSLTPYGIFNAKLDGIEEDIDAIEATRNLHTYTSFKQLGITDISALTSWAGLIPINSQLVITVSQGTCGTLYANKLIPIKSPGALTVTNHNMRGSAIFHCDNDLQQFFVGISNNISSVNISWNECVKKSDLAPKDITSSVTAKATFHNFSVIRSGNVVTVSLRCDTTLSASEVILEKLPNPLTTVYGVPLIGSSTNDVVSFMHLYTSGALQNIKELSTTEARVASFTYICADA